MAMEASRVSSVGFLVPAFAAAVHMHIPASSSSVAVVAVAVAVAAVSSSPASSAPAAAVPSCTAFADVDSTPRLGLGLWPGHKPMSCSSQCSFCFLGLCQR